ncbi:MAG: FG-GAP repeat protein, partial [FCB group bacterium]|nr:FG-GAP repeat protein [FCB group bacterium]
MKMTICLIVMLAFLSVAQAQVIETQRLISDDIAAEDYFGSAVAVSGDYAIIGACYDDENGENSGSAYIFHNNGETWEQYQKITASDGQTNDFFAITVTISGDYAFVNSLWGNNYAGKVYVFYNDAGTWTETSILIASDGEAEDFFGTSMSISGDYAIIGAYGNDDSGSESGSAYIFYNDEGIWTETTKLTAFDGNENDRFGISVGIYDDYAIIGADGSANNSGTNSGTAYIFYNNLGNWEQTQQIESLDAVLGDQFGTSVSMSGEYAAIGADYKSDDGTWSGAAYVFHDNSGIWEQNTKLTASDAGTQKHFGNSIEIAGDILIVGSNGNIAFTPYIAGSAYMFKKILGSWQETAILQASDIANEDQFAYVVDFSDDFAFVGSPRNDTNYEDAGAVYVYELIPTTGFIAGTVTD